MILRTLTISTTLFMLIATQAFAADAPPAPPADEGFTQMLIMLSIALAFFYLILWRPEQKRRKQLEEQRDSLKKGDKVTAMGILGTVHKVSEGTVILKMVDGNKIEFLRGAISEIHNANSSEDKENSKQVDLAQQQA